MSGGKRKIVQFKYYIADFSGRTQVYRIIDNWERTKLSALCYHNNLIFIKDKYHS